MTNSPYAIEVAKIASKVRYDEDQQTAKLVQGKPYDTIKEQIKEVAEKGLTRYELNLKNVVPEHIEYPTLRRVLTSMLERDLFQVSPGYSGSWLVVRWGSHG